MLRTADENRIGATLPRGLGDGMGSQIVTLDEQRRRPDELVGMRSPTALVGKRMADESPEDVKSLLQPHVKAYCDLITRNALKGDRTAVNLFAQLMGWVGAKQDLVQALVIAVGAQSPEHLRSAANAALDAESMDDEAIYVNALQHVHQYRRDHGLPALVEIEGTDEVAGA